MPKCIISLYLFARMLGMHWPNAKASYTSHIFIHCSSTLLIWVSESVWLALGWSSDDLPSLHFCKSSSWRKLLSSSNVGSSKSSRGSIRGEYQDIIQQKSKDTTITCRKSTIQWSKLNVEWMKSKRRLAVPPNKGV